MSLDLRPWTFDLGRSPVFIVFTVFTILVTGFANALHAQETPRRRWEYFYQQRAFPFDRVPAGALQAAREELRRPDLLRSPPPIAGNSWTPIGPEGIPISITSIGRISAIAVHPTNSNTIYIGGAQGGVWKTTDGGSNWSPLTDNECSLAMGAIAIDPIDPEIIYAGTGEQHFSGDSYYGCGILRSTNGGASWTNLGASIFQTPTGGARISRILIDATTAGSPSTTTIFVASDFGLYRSTNGGATLTQTLTGTVTDLVMHPTATDTLYAARRGANVSKSSDGGISWTDVGNGWATGSIGRVHITISPSSPSILYSSVHNSSTGQLLGIWKTIDGGTTWAQLAATNASCSSQCWYDQFIAVHPTNPDTVYFGGVEIYRSTSGGTSFANIRGGMHVDQHTFAFDPQNPDVVYAGNDGGIFRSNVGGGSWTSLNTNLALTQFYAGISLHPFDPSIVLGGTQDNGTLRYEGAIDWSHVLGGDGGFTAIDFENPTTQYAETQWSAGSTFGGPRRSDGGGFNRKVSGIDVSESGLFIPPLVMDPSNPEILYFGLSSLYRTANRADTWTPIGSNFGRVSAIAPAATDGGVIYIGTSTGLVHMTADTGGSWANVSAALPGRYVTDIAVDLQDWQTAYVVVSGFGSGHVFRTTDGATSWQNVSSNLPDIPVNAVLVDPATRSNVFIGTDLGVFASSDSGETWAAINTGIPNVAVFDLAYSANTGTMIAATHGRGMFSLNVNRSLTLVATPTSRHVTVASGATQIVKDSANVIVSGSGSGAANWSASSGGAPWLSLTTVTGTGTGIVSWDIDPTGISVGTYVDTITVTVPGAIDSPTLIIDTLQIAGFAAMPTAHVDTALSGSLVLIADSAEVIGLSDTTSWTVTHGVTTWLTVQPSGRGLGYSRWDVNPAGLLPGSYADTITIATSEADTARLFIALEMNVPNIAVDCAFDFLVRNQCLGIVEQRFLDLSGNGDGAFNLGDFIGHLQRRPPTPKREDER